MLEGKKQAFRNTTATNIFTDQE